MKKIYGVILALGLLILLAACSGAPTEPGAEPQAATPSVNISEPTTEPPSAPQTETEETGLIPAETETPPTTPSVTDAAEETKATGSESATTMSFQALVSQYSGRWYLDGYFDVYLDIYLNADADHNRNDTLEVIANNFAMPDRENDGSVYPDGQYTDGYCSGFGIIRNDYDYSNMTNYTRDYKISFKEGCICIGSYRFVPTQGSIAKATGITLNKTSLELYVGESETLIATVFPDGAVNKKVTWRSADRSVAAVSSDGKVTGMAVSAPGCVVITVITEDGHYMATCYVTVKERIENTPSVTEPTQPTPPPTEPSVPVPPVTDPTEPELPMPEPPTPPTEQRPVTGISLNRAEVSIAVGEQITLTATVQPADADNKGVVWFSNNTNVATVSSTGLVKAVSKGTATITVTSTDGCYTASCEVTVSEPPLTASINIGISWYASDTFAGQGIFASVNASGGSGKYVEFLIRFFRNGVFIGESTNNEILVTPAISGTYTAEAYVVDSSGNTVSVTKTTNISIG